MHSIVVISRTLKVAVDLQSEISNIYGRLHESLLDGRLREPVAYISETTIGSRKSWNEKRLPCLETCGEAALASQLSH
jgi:hypothetical protein